MSGTPADAVFIDAATEAFAADTFGADALFSAAAGYEVPGAGGAALLGVGEGGSGGGGGGWDGTGAVPSGFEGFGMGPEGSLAAMDTLGSTGMLDSTFNTAVGGGFSWGDVKGALQFASPIASIGSGLYGMTQADALRKQAMLAGQRGDPWGSSGGRGLADQQLQQLMRDPSGTSVNDPAYKLRMQGAQRATATTGQNSGAMAVAGANASSDWFNQRLAQLGGLAGAGAAPGGGSVELQGTMGANDLTSKSLASIGYGTTRAGGSDLNMPPEVQQWLRSKGVTA